MPANEELISYLRSLWIEAVPSKYATLLDAKSMKTKESIRIPVIEASATWQWDPVEMTFKTMSGRSITYKEIDMLSTRVVDAVDKHLGEIGSLVSSGSTDYATMQAVARTAIRDVSNLSAARAAGGWNQMTNSDWGYTGARTRNQYDYLNDLFNKVKDGDVTPESLPGRMKLYLADSDKTYEGLRRRLAMKTGLYHQERRIADSNPCEDCEQQAGMGWQPIGTLKGIGECLCMGNCHCTMVYRGEPGSTEDQLD